MASLSYRSVTHTGDFTFSSSTATANAPAGATTDDIVLVFISIYAIAPAAAPTVSSVPSGWTQVATNTATLNSGAVNFRGYVYRKIIAGGESYAWGLSAAAAWGASAICHDNPNTSGPVQTATFNSGSSASAVMTGITLDQSAQGLVGYVASDNAATSTPPSGMTERYDDAGGGLTMVDELSGLSAGATGDRTATLSASSGYVSWLVALYSEDSTAGGGVTVKTLAAMGVG